MKLTDKQQRFVAEYVIDLNATQAAIRAGYAAKTANREGSRLLSNVDVAQAIARKAAEKAAALDLSAERVLKGLFEEGDPYRRGKLPRCPCVGLGATRKIPFAVHR